MNKKILSIIVILITAISVFIMLKPEKDPYEEDKTYRDSTQVNNDSKNINTNNKPDTVEYKDKKDKVEDKDKKKDHDLTQYKTNDNNKTNSNAIRKTNRVQKDITEGEKDTKYSEDNKYDYKENSQPVFKVQKEKIPEQLTLSERFKILSIANKLSSIDYGKINDYLSKENDEDAMRETVKLLKLRLDKKDYEEVKKIMNRFINNIEGFETES